MRVWFGQFLRFIKDFPLLYQLYRWRTERILRKKNLKEDVVFELIYINNEWNNKESVSGIGSMEKHTKIIVDKLPELCKKYNVKTILDAPCGDFNWMKRVKFSSELKYIGGDIVEKLIEANNRNYESDDRKFVQLNILKDDLIKCDLIFVRDCLVHFSYKDINSFLSNLMRSEIEYLLTTSFPKTKNNYDITTGNWRALNLQNKPLSFPRPLDFIHEKTEENKFQYYDKSLYLYKVSELKMFKF
jgi:hypothetical protein